VAYAAVKGGKRLVVVDSQEAGNYDAAVGQGSMIFSADGTLEYLAVKESTLYRIKHAPASLPGYPR
jgi:hypothetical protein